MRRAAGVLIACAALLAAAIPVRAAIDNQTAPASPAQLAQAWVDAQAGLAQARADLDALRAQPADANPILEARRQLALAATDYAFREAARAQQVVAYRAAIDPDVEAEVLARVGATDQAALHGVLVGLRALWRSAGIEDLGQVRIRHNRSFMAPATSAELMSYYRASGARYGIDWTYLAAINYVESGFGRSLGPSSAGAMGPMQFMPATWGEYGGGGDIMSPHDSIEAAARFLRAMGGPGSMDRAIYRYNNDRDYVASIEGFAGAFRADPTLLDRMFYWSTAG